MRPSLGPRFSCSIGLAAFLALHGVAPVRAQIVTPPSALYTCRDADGRTISSDRPIPACADRSMRELNADGSVRRVIPAPLTREQQQQQVEAERQRRIDELDRRARIARDRNLLLRFEDETALNSIRQRSLAEIDQEILDATQRILVLDRELKAAQEAVASHRVANPRASVPFAMNKRVTDAANAILAEDARINDRRSERARVDARFASDAKRLRELLGMPAADRFAARGGVNPPTP